MSSAIDKAHKVILDARLAARLAKLRAADLALRACVAFVAGVMQGALDEIARRNAAAKADPDPSDDSCSTSLPVTPSAEYVATATKSRASAR